MYPDHEYTGYWPPLNARPDPLPTAFHKQGPTRRAATAPQASQTHYPPSLSPSSYIVNSHNVRTVTSINCNNNYSRTNVSYVQGPGGQQFVQETIPRQPPHHSNTLPVGHYAQGYYPQQQWVQPQLGYQPTPPLVGITEEPMSYEMDYQQRASPVSDTGFQGPGAQAAAGSAGPWLLAAHQEERQIPNHQVTPEYDARQARRRQPQSSHTIHTSVADTQPAPHFVGGFRESAPPAPSVFPVPQHAEQMLDGERSVSHSAAGHDQEQHPTYPQQTRPRIQSVSSDSTVTPTGSPYSGRERRLKPQTPKPRSSRSLLIGQPTNGHGHDGSHESPPRDRGETPQEVRTPALRSSTAPQLSGQRPSSSANGDVPQLVLNLVKEVGVITKGIVEPLDKIIRLCHRRIEKLLISGPFNQGEVAALLSANVALLDIRRSLISADWSLLATGSDDANSVVATHKLLNALQRPSSEGTKFRLIRHLEQHKGIKQQDLSLYLEQTAQADGVLKEWNGRSITNILDDMITLRDSVPDPMHDDDVDKINRMFDAVETVISRQDVSRNVLEAKFTCLCQAFHKRLYDHLQLGEIDVSDSDTEVEELSGSDTDIDLTPSDDPEHRLGWIVAKMGEAQISSAPPAQQQLLVMSTRSTQAQESNQHVVAQRGPKSLQEHSRLRRDQRDQDTIREAFLPLAVQSNIGYRLPLNANGNNLQVARIRESEDHSGSGSG